MLNEITNNFPQIIFGSGIRPENLSLVLSTSDTTDWKLWNRNWILSDVFKSFEIIQLTIQSIDLIVKNQIILENLQLQLNESKKLYEESLKSNNLLTETIDNNNNSLNSQNNHNNNNPLLKKQDLKVNDIVYYHNKVTGNQEIVKILGIHYDDFPNIYYTIISEHSNDKNLEKQTDSSRLSFINTLNSSKNQTISMKSLNLNENDSNNQTIYFTVTHGTTQYQIEDVNNTNTVLQLKQLLQNVTNIPVSKMKLICKGSSLIDRLKLMTETKLTNNGKLVLIGTSAVK